MKHIPFNKPYMTGREVLYIQQAHDNCQLSGNGPFTQKCHAWLEEQIGCVKALLTHSCTAALEMAAILADVRPGDEIIMPSYTFVSTANAFVLRGGVPVFVDIRADTLNVDETKIESAITSKTTAIVPVHYAGLPCEMDTIMDIATRHELLVIEDAAQALMSTYKKRPAGSIGHIAAVSFHETKNIISGEGGALLVNDRHFAQRADIIREKGTNRTHFLKGEVDRYKWVDIGSSFLPSELVSAFLYAQFEAVENIIAVRRRIFARYQEGLKPLEENGILQLPCEPTECICNGHIFYVITPSEKERARLLAVLKEQNINAVTHYEPLHASPAGKKYGRLGSPMTVTESICDRVLRLPFYYELTDEDMDRVIQAVHMWANTQNSEYSRMKVAPHAPFFLKDGIDP